MKVYANKETNIYHSAARGDQCRQAEILPENLVKFPDAAAAESAGYTACKSCFKA
jgi:methylphosphotriester-DNA--protein-cysteine methyltransferase